MAQSMKKQLEQILEILETAAEAAGERADESERDATIEKYEEVKDCIEEAASSIQDAINRLDEK